MYKFKNPYLTLLIHFSVVFATYIVITGYTFDEGFSQFSWLVLLFFLGFFLGPLSVLIDIFSISFKLGYIIALALLAVTIIWGIRKRNKWWGHIISILGLFGWLYCGMLGMGA